MMKLKVWAEGPVTFRAILENPNHVAHLTFNRSDELIAFIVEMPIDYVAVIIHNQSTLEYGFRLDSRGLRDSINFYQSGKRGRKRSISVGDE